MYIYVCVYVCICVCVYVCVYIYVYVCVCVCVGALNKVRDVHTARAVHRALVEVPLYTNIDTQIDRYRARCMHTNRCNVERTEGRFPNRTTSSADGSPVGKTPFCPFHITAQTYRYLNVCILGS